MIHHNSIQFDGFAHYSISSLEFVSERLKRRIKSTSLYQSLRHQFHIAPPPIKRPIFIVGTIRSGKTILAKCLGNHPRIVYLGYELTTEWCDFANIEIARSNANKTQCPPYGESDATEAGCRHVRHGFAELHVQKGGSRGTRLLDENPHLWNKLPFLVRIFPDANLLITGRDIRSTVASMKVLWIEQHKNNGKKYYFPRDTEYCWTAIPPARPDEMDASRIFPGGDLVVLAEYWLHTYEMIEKTIDGVTPLCS